jgi:anti-sigma factor RsiW
MWTMEKDNADEPRHQGGKVTPLLQDERLLAMLSAYLDGGLEGEELTEFERLLRENKGLAREVENMRWIENQLKCLAGDVLDEPIPESLLNTLRRRD